MREFFIASVARLNNGKYHIFPQYEILENGDLKQIEFRASRFPDAAKVYCPDDSKLIDNYVGVLAKFSIDMDRKEYIHNNYPDPYRKTEKYVIRENDFEELNRDELIEFVKIDTTFEKIIAQKANRKIIVPFKPLNKKLILGDDQYLYGPFEYAYNTDIEADDISKVTIRPLTGENSISKYNRKDVRLYDAQITSAFSDKKLFIWNLTELDGKEIECIDFSDNETIINEFKNLLNYSTQIENVSANTAKLLDDINLILNNMENIDFKESKLRRLQEAINLSIDLNDYKNKFLKSYFSDNPASEKDKLEYLKSNPDVLKSVVWSISGADEELAKIEAQRKELLDKKNQLEIEIDIKKAELKDTEGYQEKVLEGKKIELDSIQTKISNFQEEISKYEALLGIAEECVSLQQKNEELLKENKRLNIINDDAKGAKKAFEKELTEIKERINDKITQLAIEKMNNEIINLLFTNISVKQQQPIAEAYTNYPVESNYGAEDIFGVFEELFKKANRKVERIEIINYVISISQNFITLFAGEPGVGKTSLCGLIAKGFGIYDKRFTEISVERGWTSPRDLIGYYNPLTQKLEKPHPSLFNCLETINYEYQNSINSLPYFILLDEANLSNIEHYWSNFNLLNDDYYGKCVEISENDDHKFYLTESIRFLATINYDHTTEMLSPRFLDRAWVILVDPPSFEDLLSKEISEDEVRNISKIIDFATISKYFIRNKNAQITQRTKQLIEIVLSKFKEIGHSLSARSIKAIIRYATIAEQYMPLDEDYPAAVDYAIAQKILPLVNGYGENYRENLMGLNDVLEKQNLRKCTRILDRIIKCGDMEHQNYQFFNM